MAVTVEPAVIVPALVAGTLYLRGWVTLACRMPDRFGPGRLLAFMTGLATLLLVLGEPLDTLASQFLSAHMVQHLVLMLVAPPLLWMGAPVAPLLCGLPRGIRRRVARGLAWPPIRRLTHVLARPGLGWAAFVLALWAWHVPGLYELALRSHSWHHAEHACFLATALLFWRPVILPWPARSPWPRWAMIPYLVLADVQNSALAAILVFSDRVVYPSYAAASTGAGGRALEDQAIAGLIMWVPGAMAFLLPIVWLVVTAIASPGPARATPSPPLEPTRGMATREAR
jgi:cytochrome c oxidase assembly factor CtaG